MSMPWALSWSAKVLLSKAKSALLFKRSASLVLSVAGAYWVMLFTVLEVRRSKCKPA